LLRRLQVGRPEPLDEAAIDDAQRDFVGHPILLDQRVGNEAG
jgi:hypothetical protein